MPRQQLVQSRGMMVADAAEDISKPGTGIDPIQACRHDERIHRGSSLATAIGSGEQPGLPSHGDPAKCALACVVAQTNTAIWKQAAGALPPFEHVVQRAGDIGMARELGACRAHPVFQIGHERYDHGLMDSSAPSRGLARDLVLCREDGVDPAHGFYSRRRLAQFREFEELAAGVSSAARFGDRSRQGSAVIKAVESGRGIGLQDTLPPGKITGGDWHRHIGGRRDGRMILASPV
jgi:hypothetical protein